MAKDKIKLYTGEPVMKNALNESEKHWKRSKYYNSLYCIVNEYYLQYSFIEGTYNYGYLTIDVSLSKLLNGNNAIPATQINIDKIKKIIYSDLGHVLNFNNIQNDFTDWTISKDETFIDIIANKEIIEGIWYILEYCKIAYRKADLSYNDQGTLYIHSGSKREKANWTLVAYDKGKECAKRGYDISTIKNLKEGQMCLRLELKTKLKMLKKIAQEYIKTKHETLISKPSLKKIYCKLLNSQVYFLNHKIYQNIIIPHLNCQSLNNISIKKLTGIIYNYQGFFDMFKKLNEQYNKITIADILSSNFQGNTLKNVFKDLHLFDDEIKILTKKKFNYFVEKNESFKTKTLKDNGKIVIDFLNGKNTKRTPSYGSIIKYKKLCLNSGIHFLYVKHSIPEISQDILNTAIYETGTLVIE